ncbi:restriction endonuclease subunit S [Comamonas sp. GB3 AK4-5]|uniref:restriction endonuclease subunit S n=1 Tax=Comamonas sp. GB3 AK4-5 TaxID=3231487 RepID=UPI00351F1AD8
MQRYESYKSSDAAWLGNVPSHWGVQPLRAVTSLKSDKNRPDLPVLSVYREYGVILKDSRDDNHNATSLDTSTYKVVKPGDLVVNKMKAWQGSMGVSVHDGIVSPAYITCTTKADRVRPAYLHYLLRSSPLIGVYNSLSYGVRVGQWDMHYEDFKQIQIPLPPKDEQDRIVAFLDQKTDEIEAAIAKKERLIELIKEQKHTCIEKAITEGLEVPKNSEVGLSPKHWSRVKLKYCINLLPGFAFKSSSYSSNDSDIPLLRGVNVNPGKLNWEDKVSWPKASLAPHLKYLLEPGDLVIGMDRPWVADGIRVAPVQACDLPCLLLQRVARLRAANRITQEFLALVLTSRGFLTYFEPMLTGISVPHISPEQIGNYEATLPPVEEQEAICKFVSQLSTSCEQAIAKETQIVNGLRQLRASVIADVVLGKRKI